MKQLEITNYLEPYKNPLSVIKNGKPAIMTIDDIFDSEKYDELKCVTYVASPKLFCDLANGFRTAELIIGIKDGSVQENILDNCKPFLSNEPIDFWLSASDDLKSVRGKMILPSHGKEFFHLTVSTFLHALVISFLHGMVSTFLHIPVSSFFKAR